MTKMTIDTMAVLGMCAEIERKNMELYDLFAECFAADAEMAKLWHKVAREEENHANQFQLAAKLREGAIDSVTVDPWRAQNTLKVVQSIIDAVKLRPPTPEDALRSAIKLEEHLAGFHVECVACFEDKHCQKLFHAMMAVDDSHMSHLKEVYERKIKKRGL